MKLSGVKISSEPPTDEQKLGEMRSPSIGARFSHGWISMDRLTGMFVGFGFLVLAPFLHLGVFFNFWTTKKTVDKVLCGCSCWDTFFKGSYEGISNKVSEAAGRVFMNA